MSTSSTPPLPSTSDEGVYPHQTKPPISLPPPTTPPLPPAAEPTYRTMDDALAALEATSGVRKLSATQVAQPSEEEMAQRGVGRQVAYVFVGQLPNQVRSTLLAGYLGTITGCSHAIVSCTVRAAATGKHASHGILGVLSEDLAAVLSWTRRIYLTHTAAYFMPLAGDTAGFQRLIAKTVIQFQDQVNATGLSKACVALEESKKASTNSSTVVGGGAMQHRALQAHPTLGQIPSYVTAAPSSSGPLLSPFSAPPSTIASMVHHHHHHHPGAGYSVLHNGPHVMPAMGWGAVPQAPPGAYYAPHPQPSLGAMASATQPLNMSQPVYHSPQNPYGVYQYPSPLESHAAAAPPPSHFPSPSLQYVTANPYGPSSTQHSTPAMAQPPPGVVYYAVAPTQQQPQPHPHHQAVPLPNAGAVNYPVHMVSYNNNGNLMDSNAAMVWHTMDPRSSSNQ